MKFWSHLALLLAQAITGSDPCVDHEYPTTRTVNQSEVGRI
jgi:hypothetical protein